MTTKQDTVSARKSGQLRYDTINVSDMVVRVYGDTAVVTARADAPATGSIPWLLLRAKSHDGAGTFAAVAFVRRSLTKDGAAPAGGCDAAHRGAELRVAYSALYQFYGAAR